MTKDGKIWVAICGQTVNSSIIVELFWVKDGEDDIALKFTRSKKGSGGSSAVKVSITPQDTQIPEAVILSSSDNVHPEKLFTPSAWCLNPTDGTNGTNTMTEEAEEESDSSIIVIDSETYMIQKTKESELKFKILSCALIGIVGQYRMTCRNENGNKSSVEPVYEVLVEIKTNPNGFGTKFVNDTKRLDDRYVNQYSKIVIPVDIRLSDLKSTSHISEKLGSYWPPLGMTLTRKFNVGHIRDIFQDLNKKYLDRGGSILRCIENFGLQYNTVDKIFCFSNLSINVTTGEICEHQDVGFKLIPEVLSQGDLSSNFYPSICPVEEPVLRLRFFRTLIYTIKKFTGINFELSMLLMAVYAAAPHFEEIQEQLSGFFISVLTSQEGSTGKTEVIKMMNSLFGMPNKAMCASASEAGLYELLGNLFSSIPICVDDLKWDPKAASGKLDETIKSLYDAMVRVVFGKMRASRCPLVVTCNYVFCPNDQPVQSRLLLQCMRKSTYFDPGILQPSVKSGISDCNKIR